MIKTCGQFVTHPGGILEYSEIMDRLDLEGFAIGPTGGSKPLTHPNRNDSL